ncbi:MAG: Stp1/IreP family PP2C-type Ser/Thr phosphatase [Kofleriaceae bacterium]|nr:Stp1/IreP family PP2C-type Ser/Thr phosphatase [Kofleriaceae bacterium]
MSTPFASIKVAGDTNVGKVRTANEDSMIVDAQRGLYVVLDGMGGANAGDVASQMARDAIHQYVKHTLSTMDPKLVLSSAIQAGSAAVFAEAQANREKHGMGTTCVACLLVDAQRAIIAHVGDSRAYLLRHGRLQALTKDHTIVEELVSRGMLSGEDAERHPYKNVLSRNLGARPEARVDVLDLELKPGDRLLLCSDGLYGYASAEAIQYLLGSGDAPEHVARDLIELALRGGGGDNVTTIVLEVPQVIPSTTQFVRTNGAIAWWQRRQRFLHLARERGLTRNPMVRGLDPDEAMELVALSLCQAVFHDLEKSTGVNVWTFAQNLASGWFERGGEWTPLRQMMDILSESANIVVDELRTIEPQLGFLLEIAVGRAFVVAELALGGLLADRLAQIDASLIAMHTASQAVEAVDALDTLGDPDTGERFIERPTIPFLRPDRPVTSSGESAEVLSAIEKTLTIARARTTPRADLVKHVLMAIEALATDGNAVANAESAARDIYGMRSVDEAGIMPLFDALDQARMISVSAVHQIQSTDPVRARVLRAISAAHQRLVGASTALVLEACLPFSEKLRDAQNATAELRDKVAQAEKKRAKLERTFATGVDPSLPWGHRGNTEW